MSNIKEKIQDYMANISPKTRQYLFLAAVLGGGTILVSLISNASKPQMTDVSKLLDKKSNSSLVETKLDSNIAEATLYGKFKDLDQDAKIEGLGGSISKVGEALTENSTSLLSKIEALNASNQELLEKLQFALIQLDEVKKENTTESIAETQPAIETVAAAKIKIPLNEAYKKKTTKDTIPAGSSVKARLLTGLYADTSIATPGTPIPLTMIVTDALIGPNHFKVNLADCRITGAAAGDLSAERVKIRLEKLSCVNPQNNEIIEAKLEGYVTGEDGMNGMRGDVISRDGEYLRNSFSAGLFSGLGKTVTPENSIVPFGAGSALSPAGIGTKFGMGAGEGVSNAMDKLSDFYIKKADSLQPVIEMKAGRDLDIHFREAVTLLGHNLDDFQVLDKPENYDQEELPWNNVINSKGEK